MIPSTLLAQTILLLVTSLSPRTVHACQACADRFDEGDSVQSFVPVDANGKPRYYGRRPWIEDSASETVDAKGKPEKEKLKKKALKAQKKEPQRRR